MTSHNYTGYSATQGQNPAVGPRLLPELPVELLRAIIDCLLDDNAQAHANEAKTSEWGTKVEPRVLEFKNQVQLKDLSATCRRLRVLCLSVLARDLDVHHLRGDWWSIHFCDPTLLWPHVRSITFSRIKFPGRFANHIWVGPLAEATSSMTNLTELDFRLFPNTPGAGPALVQLFTRWRLPHVTTISLMASVPFNPTILLNSCPSLRNITIHKQPGRPLTGSNVLSFAARISAPYLRLDGSAKNHQWPVVLPQFGWNEQDIRDLFAVYPRIRHLALAGLLARETSIQDYIGAFTAFRGLERLDITDEALFVEDRSLITPLTEITWTQDELGLTYGTASQPYTYVGLKYYVGPGPSTYLNDNANFNSNDTAGNDNNNDNDSLTPELSNHADDDDDDDDEDNDDDDDHAAEANDLALEAPRAKVSLALSQRLPRLERVCFSRFGQGVAYAVDRDINGTVVRVHKVSAGSLVWDDGYPVPPRDQE